MAHSSRAKQTTSREKVIKSLEVDADKRLTDFSTTEIEVMKVRTIKESRECPPSQEFAIKTNQVHLRKEGRKKNPCDAKEIIVIYQPLL